MFGGDSASNNAIFLLSLPSFRHAGSTLAHFYFWELYPYVLLVVYPVGLMAQTCSAYMTVGVTIERYLVVCWPLKSRSICTNGRAKMGVALFAGFAVFYNIPR